MKAILQVNGFQKIVDIPEPKPYIKIAKQNIASLVTFQDDIVLRKEPSEILYEEVLFELIGQTGEFLLYELR